MIKIKFFKYITLLLTLGFFMNSCGENEQQEEEKTAETGPTNFEIKGTIEAAGEQKLYLEALSNNGTINVAECKIQKDGAFKMGGNIPGLGIYQLRLGEGGENIIPLTMIPNDKVTLNAHAKTYSILPQISGTEWAQNMTDFMRLFGEFANQQQELQQLQGKVSEDVLMEKVLLLKKPMDDFCKKKMLETPSNPINIILSTSVNPSTGFKYWDPENLTVLKTVAEAYGKRYVNSPIAGTINQQVIQLEKAYNDFIAFNSGSQAAPDFTVTQPNGQPIRLSDLKGQVVLIDFWASWCGPCRKANPEVVRIYNKYHKKGFTVFSVSLDDKMENWKAAIVQDGLIWPNHGSDLKGWNTPLIQLYNFQAIPYTVLVDKKGNIVGTNLRGISLEQKLDELLK